MKALNWIFLILLVVGGLNRGLVGLFEFNLVEFIFGSMSVISRIIYIIVGIAAVRSLIVSLRD